jgi:hypothetical protein
VRGDSTRLYVAAIVNAATESLLIKLNELTPEAPELALRVVHVDRARPSTAPSAARLDHGRVASADGLAGFVSFVQRELLPDVQQKAGYRALWIAQNEHTGDVVVGTEWDTSEQRDAAAPAFLPVLRRASEFGLTPVRLYFVEHINAVDL